MTSVSHICFRPKASNNIFCILIRRCLELEILSSTYSASTLSALRKIRRHLVKSVADTEAEIDQIRANLQQYEAVGTDFETVVKEYAKLKEEIAGKKWALKELKKEGGGGSGEE